MLKTLISLLILGFYASMLAQDITISSRISMLALGDSYTIGTSVSKVERWPHQFINELRALGVDAEDPDYIATNGWTTGRLLQGLRTYLDTDKDYNLVSILIGVNNQYQGLDISIYEPDLKELIDRALQLVGQDTSRIFILSIPDYAYTPFGGGRASISREIDEYNAIKQRVAARYNIAYIDITPISRLGLGRPSLVAGDGLHPSGQQYKEWVEQIIPRVDLAFTTNASFPESSQVDPLFIYPNPTTAEIRIHSHLDWNRLRVINLQGKLLLEIEDPNMPLELDLSLYPSGSYIISASPSEDLRKDVHRQVILLPGR